MTLHSVRARLAGVFAGALLVSACVSTSLVDVQPTNAIADPKIVTTPTGAMQLYNVANAQWSAAVGGSASVSGGLPTGDNLINSTGWFTDELMWVIGDDEDNNWGQGTDERN